MNVFRPSVFAASAMLWASLASATPFEDCKPVEMLSAYVRSGSAQIPDLVAKDDSSRYLIQLVRAAHSFETAPKSKNRALELLDKLPQSEEQFVVWISLGDLLCDGEAIADMMTLGHLGDRLPRLVMRAVTQIPLRLPKVLRFALVARRDPHSDYAVQLQRLCKLRKRAFLEARESLTNTERRDFDSGVFDVRSCRAKALPEAGK
jgi:hypothetical protein